MGSKTITSKPEPRAQAEKQIDLRPLPPADPPRPHRWLLALSIVCLAAWMLFLAYLALGRS
jgi:hypothetical protein